jgi:type IV secretion system protein VirB4
MGLLSPSRERSAERYLPIVGHVTDSTLLLNDGSLLAMLELHGTPFELEEHTSRNARHFARNTLFRTIADDTVHIASHLVRHDTVPSHAPGRFRTGFARDLDAAYRDHVLSGRLRRNQWFLSIVVTPRVVLGRWASGKLAKLHRPTPSATDGLVQALDDMVAIVSRTMDGYGLRRLGLREQDGVLFSEPAEAMRLILTARAGKVPLVQGQLGAAIYTDRAITGMRGIELRPAGQPYFGSILGLREYPSPTTRLGMLNPVLALDCSLVLTQTFGFQTRAQSQAALSLKHAQLESAEDAALSQRDALLQAKDDIATNSYVNGVHHLSLALYGDTLDQAREHAAQARAALTNAGAVFAEEGIGAEAAYWSQIPGNWEWRTRPGGISSRNFSALSTFDNYPAGSPTGYWGAPLIRFRTTGGTHYDYHMHVGSVGHTAIFGPTGSGKTTFLLFLLAMLEQAMTDQKGSIVLFDKDAGGEVMVRAAGGSYLRLRRGEPSGLAPLRALTDTPSDTDFLIGWLSGLIRSDGGAPITPEEQGRLERGVRRQLRMPPELRSMAGLREFLGHADPNGAGARVERWCRGGALGWAFDNDEDEIRLDGPITGFDMGAVLEQGMADSPVSGSMAAYILHRVQNVMDGRRFVMAADEFWMYLTNPLFAAAIDNFLLTLRKVNGALVLATQQPEHALDRPIGASLVAQCMTKVLFPNHRAREESYGPAGLGCSPAVFRAVREDLLGSRSFVLLRDSGAVVCEFDLSAIPEQVALLSSTRNRVKLLDRIRAETGDDPALFVPEFQRRHLEAVD